MVSELYKIGETILITFNNAERTFLTTHPYTYVHFDFQIVQNPLILYFPQNYRIGQTTSKLKPSKMIKFSQCHHLSAGKIEISQFNDTS